MIAENKCHIVLVGRRRDGGMKYWCLEHKADATAKYGRRAKHCRHAHIRPMGPDDTYTLDVSTYSGGIAVWGAVPPVYDTTRLTIDTGVHIHARDVPAGSKRVDGTYRSVILRHRDLPGGDFIITEWDAIYFMVASVFGFQTKEVLCTTCGHTHLDKDWFSVNMHQTHLCAGCGKNFRDIERGIGNPLSKLQQVFCRQQRSLVPGKEKMALSQKDYPGGIQIWGSNPAIVWTAQRSEEEGIHVHAFNENKNDVIDDTFSGLEIDGIDLDPTMVRVYMAQNALPHIAGRIVDILCPRCRAPHFDTDERAFTPHEHHLCINCGYEFQNKGRMRKTIGNPVHGVFASLADTAPRRPRIHKSELLVENL
ncbi:MAG: hypothetical protein MN733_06470 [Nitrososphaera sp.]|nr:hypothetical protein [Nitrososphaera sp.]